jgi:translation initiation factor IF-3
MSIKINHQITASSVRVIDSAGVNIGTMLLTAALAKAIAEEKDLIEIVPTAIPPVCKIMEYGKYQYEQKKAQKPQKTPAPKEFRFSVNIDPHDLKIKADHIIELLIKGHLIRIAIIFRGREITHKDNGIAVLEQLKTLIPLYTFDPVKQEDKQLITTVRPK